MSRGVNKAIILGYLGADPDVKTLPSGDMVANFSMATSESWRDKRTSEIKERTEWHNITVYGKTAETIQKYAKKGTQAYVEGSIRSNKYQDKNGVERVRYEIVANLFRLIGSRPQAGANPYSAGQEAHSQPQSTGFSPTPAATTASSPSALSTTDLDDEIPF